MVLWIVLLAAVSVALSGGVLLRQHLQSRAVGKRLAPVLYADTREDIRRLIDAAGSADAVILAALREASAGIERAHRAGALSPVNGDSAMLGLLRAKRSYARTGDDELDAFRALTLAHEADACASRTASSQAPFDEWLRTNGHTLMR